LLDSDLHIAGRLENARLSYGEEPGLTVERINLLNTAPDLVKATGHVAMQALIPVLPKTDKNIDCFHASS